MNNSIGLFAPFLAKPLAVQNGFPISAVSFRGRSFFCILWALCACFPYFIYHRFSLPMILYWISSAFGFLLTTLIRKKRNAPRPTEVFLFLTPLLSHKSGCSFPSRHTACAFLISFCSAFPFPALEYFLRFLLFSPFLLSCSHRNFPRGCRSSFSQRCDWRIFVCICYLPYLSDFPLAFLLF